MKINELKGKDLTGLLTELFALSGAKEIFARHNIEMVTRETELNGLENLLKGITKLFNESKAAQEYKQAVMFLDTQINTNKSMLATAEGFMKTMIEGMIHSFESTKLTAVMSQSELFRKELYCLLENILNEDDVKTVQGYMDTMSLDKIDDFMKQVETVKANIENRYSGKAETVETKVEVKAEEKTAKTVKEKDSLEEQLDDFDLSDLDEEPKKPEPKKKEIKKEVEPEPEVETPKAEESEDDFDLSDLDDLDMEETPKPEKKEVAKKEVAKKEPEDDFDLENDDLDFGDLDDLADVDPFL